jgi:hypothetical protein
LISANLKVLLTFKKLLSLKATFKGAFLKALKSSFYLKTPTGGMSAVGNAD